MQALFEDIKRALADHYVIEREEGSGGMATVFLARDIKHDRRVAVKVLRPELAAVLGPSRFLQEIRVTANLQHPHILPLFDSGQAEGFLYYVMPFVEGETLTAKLDREKQLSIDDSLCIAGEVARALSYAHARGVIHRDIKPGNILLGEGGAMVADFGIALALRTAGGARLTETGLSLGTPEYMSPEQATGDHQIDSRADIYSLGAVLYEMLAGEPPHTGRTVQAVIAKLMTERPTPPRTLRDTVPEAVDGAVMKALAKTPADRFATAQQFLNALTSSPMPPPADAVRPVAPGRGGRSSAIRSRARVIPATVVLAAAGLGLWFGLRHAGPEALDPQRLAVLYFDHPGAADELALLADGLTEALIDTLRKTPPLVAISRNGIAPFKGSSLPPVSIADSLDVQTLIAGSVERINDSLVVLVRSIDGFTGVEVQRRRITAATGEVSALQRALAGVALDLLRTKPPGREAAWILVQEANRLRRDAEERQDGGEDSAAVDLLRRADSILRRAERADTSWVEPVILRARIADRRSSLEQDTSRMLEWLAATVAHASRALEIDSDVGAALAVRGLARYRHWLLGVERDTAAAARLLEDARRDLERAIGRDPRLAAAYSVLSHLYLQIGDPVAAAFTAERAYEEDAYLQVSDDLLFRLYASLYELQEAERAGRWCEEGRRRFPEDFRFLVCQLWMMTLPGVTAHADVAWRVYGQMDPLVPQDNREYYRRSALLLVGGIIGRAGLLDSAQRVLDRATRIEVADPMMQLVIQEAFVRTLAGDDANAVELLDRYLRTHPGALYSGDEVYWWWKDLVDHPGFDALMRRQ